MIGCRLIASELIRLPVAIIVANVQSWALVAKAATTSGADRIRDRQR